MTNTERTTAGQASGTRKREHLRIALNEDVGFTGITTGLEDYRFVHQALPEIDLDAVDLTTRFLGKELRAPLLISSMVGGVSEAAAINRNLAQAARAIGVAMAVGSLRAAVDDERAAASYRVRDIAPDILLFANLGAIQLNNGYGVAECARAVTMIGADALILHLNPLQEALQAGGNTNFAGLLRRIGEVCRELAVPVVVKEVGWGISGETARRLAAAGVAAIDVAGAGGTSWSEVERRRAPDAVSASIAAGFASWGIPTAASIRLVRRAVSEMRIIASGGLRTGTDAAKVVALGADLAGLATPLLKAASTSVGAAVDALREIVEGLRLSMFCIGADNLAKLKDTPLLKRQGD
ncbi:MAG: type 2 isopentenyl-diphosphate Delta-isomerase [Chloroflexi bacterium]|nr:type 2 isopentenyl-diphosphate Delta-isomerase [Chloroflexota bacterium]